MRTDERNRLRAIILERLFTGDIEKDADHFRVADDYVGLIMNDANVLHFDLSNAKTPDDLFEAERHLARKRKLVEEYYQMQAELRHIWQELD